MNEMIERVATAIWIERQKGSWTGDNPSKREARAAIAAMHEPIEAMRIAVLERVARAIYEADRASGYDPDDPKTAWMAEDGYWPPSSKMVVWDPWFEIARAAIGAMETP